MDPTAETFHAWSRSVRRLSSRVQKVGHHLALRQSAATCVEALEEDEKEEEGDEPAEKAWECRRVQERATQERGAYVDERGGRGPERGVRQREQIEAVEHEQRGGEARVRHDDVEGRGRSVFAKSQIDLHKCQTFSRICQVSKNTKLICKTVGEVFF